MKSNDYNELVLFYPDIFDLIVAAYKAQPFPIRYEQKENEGAIERLVEITRRMVDIDLENGSFSNFVICFSEQGDLLSQWRGYANDGKGICIGFSKALLMEKAAEKNSVFRLEKVEYITEAERLRISCDAALAAVHMLNGLREWIVENMTHDDDSPDTEGLMRYNFFSWVEDFLTDSLRYKQIGFAEEREWRLYLKDQAYKKPSWVLGDAKEIIGPTGLSETVNFLRNRIEFRILDDNISPFVTVHFSEFSESPVKAVWLGPKSKICKGDMELFLAQSGYEGVEINRSSTSYR